MKRLDEIYKLIHSRKGVADIGTDHGEIPVRLAIDGFRGLIFASDVHLQPLDRQEDARRKPAWQRKSVFPVPTVWMNAALFLLTQSS